MSNYSWTDDPTKVNVATCDPDILNECLMFLKYSQRNFTTYCVNSGFTDSSGYADIIAKESNSEISFKVDNNDLYKPLVVTFPNAKTYNLTSVSGIDSITSDATYKVILEESDISNETADAIITTNTITEDKIFPSSPSADDYHLDISGFPYSGYKFDGTEWIECSFIKLGEFVKSAGIINAPDSYAFNGKYDSGIFAISHNSSYTKQHKIGTTNLKSKVYGSNSSNGVFYDFINYYDSGGTSRSATIKIASDLNIDLYVGTNAWIMLNPTSGTYASYAKIMLERNF